MEALGADIDLDEELVQLSDDLEKVSSTVESTTARLHKQLLDSK